jgi:hypothetical protein
MTVTTYDQWVADGSPWENAQCIDDFAHTMRGHGYVVYTIGNVQTHLDISWPEDHAPFSHSPWPGAQPYPYVLALDIMPGGEKDWREIGEKIHADKLAGVAGTEWIKYMNYTDTDGNCWHASWVNGYSLTGSSDTGHVHISARTDFVHAHTGYDPLRPASTSPAPVRRRLGEEEEMPQLLRDGFGIDENGKRIDGAPFTPVVYDNVGGGLAKNGPAWLILGTDPWGKDALAKVRLCSGDGRGWGPIQPQVFGKTEGWVKSIPLPTGDFITSLARQKQSADDTSDSYPISFTVHYGEDPLA